MSRKNLFAAAVIAVFLLILIPAPSQASSRNWTLFPEPVTGLLTKLERWWNSIMNGRPEPSQVWEKNGCGIDPNGLAVCDPDGPGG